MQYNKNIILHFQTSLQAALGAVENIFETLAFDQKSITELENILIKNINSLTLKIENNNQFELLTRFFNRPHIITTAITDLKNTDKFELQKFIIEKISEDLDQIQINQWFFTKSKFNKEKILKAIEIEKVKSQEPYSNNFIEKVTLCKIEDASSQKYHKDQNIKITQKTLTLRITVKPSDFNNSRLEDLHNAFNTRGREINQISENEYEIWFAHYRINEIGNSIIRNAAYDFMGNICDIHNKITDDEKYNPLHENRSDLVENINVEFRKHFEVFYKANQQHFDKCSNMNEYIDIPRYALITEVINIIQTTNMEQPQFVMKYLEKIEKSNLKSELIKFMDIIYINNIDCQLNNELYIEKANQIKNEAYEAHIYGPEPSENIFLLDDGKYIISQIMN